MNLVKLNYRMLRLYKKELLRGSSSSSQMWKVHSLCPAVLVCFNSQERVQTASSQASDPFSTDLLMIPKDDFENITDLSVNGINT